MALPRANDVGTAPDPEPEGQPDATATGDGSDEDGISFSTTPLVAGTVATLSVTVGSSGGASVAAGRLNGWVDFNRNGNWEAAEQVASDVSFASAGTHSITFSVPTSAAAAGTFARFRYSTDGGLAPGGEASDGEVEDYAVDVSSNTDLAITASASAASVIAGTSIEYLFQVGNAGPADAASAVANLTFGPGLSMTANSCALTGPTNSWALGTLAPGGSAQCAVTVAVSSAATGSVTVSGSAGSNTSDSNASNDQVSLVTPVTSSADLQIVKTGSSTGASGGSVEFTLVVTNNGPSDATGLSITDTPSAGLTIAGITGACVTGFPCEVASLAVGAALTITTTVDIAPGVSGALSNSVSVAATTSDPDPSNNTSTASLSANAVADIVVTKTGPANIIPGETAAWLLRVENLGPSDAADVYLLSS